MPDKPTTTTWSADKAFWNEAWQDMDHRLQQRRRRRSPLPWLVLALLLAGLIGAGTQVQWSAHGAVPGATSTADMASESLPDVPATTAAVAPRPTPGATDDIVYERRQTGGQGPGVNTKSVAPARPARPLVAERVPHNALVSSLIDVLPVPYLSAETKLPMLVVQPQMQEAISVKGPPRLLVSLGGSSFTRSWRPGGYGQLAYRIGRGTWQYVVALRYDYGQRKPRVDTDGLPVPTAPNPNLNYIIGSADQYRGTELLTTHQLALRIGGQRTWGPAGRFTSSGGLGVGYLLAGNGPVYSALPGVGALDHLDLREEFRSVNFQSGLQADFGPLLDASVRPVSLSGWLGVSYNLRRNWGISLGTTHYLTSTYREGRLDVDRTRIEIGLSKGF